MTYKVVVDSFATEELSGANFYFNTFEKMTEFLKICFESGNDRNIKISTLESD